ncbi:hypothetical protein [Leeuwenhoekiella sp. ZYFB001]|uniref:hypothetical protein n=1 Tax=Leeuwenhoekiella sp. ZYFB001 TaxID=2719912 RepID=UPI001430B923|nr:hypothetical protein [Leeuwenhoekiella sp. ZYFB001]
MAKNLYDLELHEQTNIFSDKQRAVDCLRVPGGWVYITYTYDPEINEQPVSSVFVPYNGEFKDKKRTVKWSDPSIH